MPINRKSILVQSGTGSETNLTTDKVEGDSYYGYSDGMHTIAISYNAFKGRIYFEGTLSLTPTENDWFNVQVFGGVSAAAGGYKQFPVTGTAGYSGVEAYNVKGNFTYLRIKMDRSHLGDGTTYDADYGALNYIRLSA
tara:strand:+ start:1069 stop:1482 length:414 start_codon:yes stop_codon:yes gene_type:complete